MWFSKVLLVFPWVYQSSLEIASKFTGVHLCSASYLIMSSFVVNCGITGVQCLHRVIKRIRWSITVFNLGAFNLIRLLLGYYSGSVNYLGPTKDDCGNNGVRYLHYVIIGVQWNIFGVNLGT